MSMNFRLLPMCVIVLLLSVLTVLGQGTTGSIEGTVKDVNGAFVPNASVKVESVGTTTGFTRTVTSDSNGYVNIPRVPPGVYRITVTATNFKTVSTETTVVVDRATPINAVLEAGGVTGEVTVTADSGVTIDPGSTHIDTNISKRLIEDLPKGTQFTSLLKIAPNVRPEALGGGFQIDGASGSENTFIIDGQEVTNFRTGTLNDNNNLPFELIQEVQVKSTGFDAEYGGATGGVINVVTLGGNDQWHGRLGASWEVPQWQGGSRPSLFRNSNASGDYDYFNPGKAEGADWFPVASISGPIIKEKLWFSAVYAPQILTYQRKFTDGTVYSNETRIQEAFARVDYQPMQNLRMYGTFLWNPIVQEGGTATVTEIRNNVVFGDPPTYTTQRNSLLGGRQNSNNVNGQVTWTPSSFLVLNFRAGRNFLNEKLNSYGLVKRTRYLCSASGSPPAGAGCSAGFNSGDNFTIDYDVSTRTTFDADAAFVGINAAGRHNLKFGYQYNRLFNTVSEGYTDTGYVVLYYGVPITALGIDHDPTPGNLGSGLLQRFGTAGKASSTNQALFVQDSWQIAKRLTLNLGFRIENEVVPSFGEGGVTQAIEFGWFDKFAPRLGVAFDLTGDHKTKLFASYGWFYDRFKYELPRGSFGGDFYRRDYFEILPERGLTYTSYTMANILGGRADALGGTCPIVGGPGYSVCQFDFRIPTNLIGADIFDSGGVDPDIKAARQSEWTIGVERELWRNMLLSGRYTHKQVDRAIEDVGVFNSQGSEAYIIGNPGLGLVCEVSTDAGRPCIKAQRDYDAFELRLDKRGRFFFNASYTLSRLYGNYSGLASADEEGRTSPNVNRFFDLPFMGYSATGEPENGRLPTDRPHVFKSFIGYTYNWFGRNINSTTVSAFTTLQSGTPITTQFILYNVDSAILNGRNDLGRTGMFTETDLFVSHRYRFGRDSRFALEPYVSIRNLFDEKNVLNKVFDISAVNFTASTLRTGGCPTALCGLPTQTSGQQENAVFDAILNGNDISQYVYGYLNARAGTSTGTFSTYGLPKTFQGPREVRFGARFSF